MFSIIALKNIINSCASFICFVPGFNPSPAGRLIKELDMDLWGLATLVVGVICRMIAYQTWPPRVALQFGPYKVIHLELSLCNYNRQYFYFSLTKQYDKFANFCISWLTLIY